MHKIKESGRNGTVEVQSDRIVRTIKKILGRDDTQVIPVKSIHEVKIDRKIIGSDIVQVRTSADTYRWKCSSAESLVDEILNIMN